MRWQKYDAVRQIYLFNWYIHGTKPHDLNALLSSKNPGRPYCKKIHQLCYQLMDVNYDI